MIDTICKTLYIEWMNNKHYWFSKDKSIDEYLINKYYYCLLNDNNLNNLFINIHNINDKEVLLGFILLLDQIPRHYNRLINAIDIHFYSLLASIVSDIVLYKNNLILNSYDYCFIHLPYRHILNITKINKTISFFINKYNDTSNITDKNIYKNFIKHSFDKVYKINTYNYITNQLSTINTDIIEWSSFKDILDFTPSINNITHDINNNVFKTIKNNIPNNTKIIVSLSGGVDSNVTTSILSNILNPNDIIAVHINYNNRDTSNNELNFVKNLCNSLHIKLFYRTINEFNRNFCHLNGLRDIYESSTKNIRFDFYKQITSLYNTNYVICLGHNKDDCFENIITNISKTQHYNNLIGMTYFNNIDDIPFWRPLLNIDKSDIISYAHNNNIPYLEDSTPKWSARGKIRDTIRPCLLNFDNNIINSFFELNNLMNSMSNIIDIFIIPNIYNKFTFNNNIIFGNFNKNEFIFDIFIWNKVFNMSNFNIFFNKKLSFKSIKEFTLAIKRFIDDFDNIHVNYIKKFVLTKNIIIKYYKNNINNLHIIFNNE